MSACPPNSCPDRPCVCAPYFLNVYAEGAHVTQSLPRIAMAGLAIESSAYAAHRAGYRDFRTLTGADQLARYPFLAEGSALRTAAQWLPVFDARSIPGGAMVPEVYADFRERILTGLQELLAEGPLDGI